MEDIIRLGWWQSEAACLVDNSGMGLTDPKMKGRGQLGETDDTLELAVLRAMKEKPFATLQGPGHPPDKVGGFCIGLIILLIRSVGGKMVRSIKGISQAAANVAQGRYGDPLPQKSQDEIGQLITSFNAMVQGLKERDFISNTFGRYVDQEIARELIRQPKATRLGGEKAKWRS